jgi:hypothetical protein
MSYEYDAYIRQHRANVQQGFQWLQENLPQVVNNLSPDLVKMHDQTKYSIEEYDAYDRYFYGRNRSFKVVSDFRMAWLHHIHHNPHDWQYWVLVNDDPKEGTIALSMDYRYIIEMICDWWSFSWKEENLYEIFNWYIEHKDRMILHEDTRKTVEEILELIKNTLDSINKKEND